MAYLAGNVTTSGTPTQGVTVRAFNSQWWGQPRTVTSDVNGDWRIDGLVNNTLYDVVYTHSDPFWEGKVSSRRLSVANEADDPFWADVTVLANFDDVTTQRFINDRGITGYNLLGGTTITTENVKFGSGSLNVTASNQGVAWNVNGTASSGEPAFVNAGEDFTVEGWFYCREERVGNYRDIVILRASDQGIVINSSNAIVFYTGSSTSITGVPIIYNKWIWVVAQRKSGVIRMWVDGIRANGEQADNATFNAFRLGDRTTTGEWTPGYFDSWRHTKAARYDHDAETLPVPTTAYVPGYPIREDNFEKNRLWVYQASNDFGAWTMGSNLLQLNGGASQPGLLWRRDFSASDIYLEGNFLTTQGGCFIWRYVDSKNYYQLTAMDANSPEAPNTLTVYRWVNGSPLQIGPRQPVSMVRGEFNKIRVEHVGSDIKVFLNDEMKLELSNSDVSGPGRLGLMGGNGGQYTGLLKLNNLKWGEL